MALNPYGKVAFSQQIVLEEGMDTKDYFTEGNYIAALQGYLDLLKDNPEDIDNSYKAGICYLFTNIDKTKAIHFLEFVTSRAKFDNEALFYLGKAYHIAMRFDDAVKTFIKYQEKANDDDIEKAGRQIEMCYNAKELIKYPLDVTFENLGKNVNSPYPDFSPFAPEDESFLVYSSRRKENKGGYVDYDGYYFSDIYMITVKNGKFSKTINLSIINTESDEEVAGISPDGNNLLVFVDDLYTYGNIYLSIKKGKAFQKLISFGENVNTGKSMETAAFLSSDGKHLYFASDINGGYGGTDIYLSKILPDGTWGLPINLGPTINTKYNEDFPGISSDEKILFFSSEGHMSIGGFDIFKSVRDDDTSQWQPPVNIGYPINTPEDNMSISFSASWDSETESLQNRYAYISAVRQDGFGDLDIYRITFNKVGSRLTVIRGLITAKIPVDISEYKTFYSYEKNNLVKLFPAECHPWYDKTWKFIESREMKVKPGYDYKTKLYFEKDGEQKFFSSKKYPTHDPAYKFMDIENTLVKKKNYVQPEITYTDKIISDAIITVTDKENGDEFTYIPAETGNYVIILPPGNYHILVDAYGFKPISEDLRIFGKSSFEAQIVKNFVLSQ
ncbi:MAG: hypothetical protein ABII90_12620 [Bacteroidota bacterium]